jgi:DNA sulfur modification protein DndD
MKIGKITLHNFRIYHGTNTVQFSDGKSGNLTIIAGKNGYGKQPFLLP